MGPGPQVPLVVPVWPIKTEKKGDREKAGGYEFPYEKLRFWSQTAANTASSVPLSKLLNLSEPNIENEDNGYPSCLASLRIRGKHMQSSKAVPSSSLMMVMTVKIWGTPTMFSEAGSY